jgi:hypothetical protein
MIRTPSGSLNRSVVCPHAAPQALRPQTLSDLMTAVKGEAFAHASYNLFGVQADSQASPTVGELFRTTAQTESWPSAGWPD